MQPSAWAAGLRVAALPWVRVEFCVAVAVRIPLVRGFIDANTAIGEFLVEGDRCTGFEMDFGRVRGCRRCLGS
jgi:hypothetical protein